jgi:uncharacterized membrane protein
MRRREDAVEKDRLLAFSDGVIAIIITIMVLELKVPHGASLHDLAAVAPVFVSYVMSFIYISIYWNNHHHFLHLVRRVDGLILWANLHLLFWLSLVPFTTGWMGENNFASVPTALYGVSLLMPAVAWQGLQYAISAARAPIRCWRKPSAAISRAGSRRCFMDSASCARSPIPGSPARCIC